MFIDHNISKYCNNNWTFSVVALGCIFITSASFDGANYSVRPTQPKHHAFKSITSTVGTKCRFKNKKLNARAVGSKHAQAAFHTEINPRMIAGESQKTGTKSLVPFERMRKLGQV